MGFAFLVILLFLLMIAVVYLIVVYLAVPVLFTILTIVFWNKKTARITFIVLAYASFIPAAYMICSITEEIAGLGHSLIFSISATVLFLMLAMVLRKEKSICTWFKALTAVCFMFAACLTYDFVFVKSDMTDSGDGEVNSSSQTEQVTLSGVPKAYYCRDCQKILTDCIGR